VRSVNIDVPLVPASDFHKIAIVSESRHKKAERISRPALHFSLTIRSASSTVAAASASSMESTTVAAVESTTATRAS